MKSPSSIDLCQKRNWSSYSKEKIVDKIIGYLTSHNILWPTLNVQEHWNCLELVILESLDYCAPLVDVKLNKNQTVTKVPSSIKNKLNLRKRLLKIERLRSSNVNMPRIRSLNVELKRFFSGARATGVRRAAMGNNVNLWKAVKVAKNLNMDSIPSNLTLGGVPIAEGRSAESFGSYFSKKIATNVGKTTVDSARPFLSKTPVFVQVTFGMSAFLKLMISCTVLYRQEY